MFAFFCKKLKLIALILPFFLTSLSASALPDFEKDSILHFSPSTTRLVSTWDGYPRQCFGERHTNFKVQSFDGDSWQDVGVILVQTKGPGSYDYQSLNIGTHVRIRSVDIQEAFQRQGIGTMAMNTLLAGYKPQGGFAHFKLEASDFDPHLSRWYRKLNFIKGRNLDGFGSDVCIYTQSINTP
jgi:GNAT superfamily N-acetyltransferase